MGQVMKKKEREDAYTKRVKKSFITPSLHLCFFEDLNPFYVGISVCIIFCIVCFLFINYKATVLSITKM